MFDENFRESRLRDLSAVAYDVGVYDSGLVYERDGDSKELAVKVFFDAFRFLLLFPFEFPERRKAAEEEEFS